MSKKSSPLKIVNTKSFCEEDLNTFLDCSERIHQRKQRQEEHRQREWLTKAVPTNMSVFESKAVTNCELAKQNGNDQSYVSQLAGLSKLLKYFEEDVEVESDTQHDGKKYTSHEEIESIKTSNVEHCGPNEGVALVKNDTVGKLDLKKTDKVFQPHETSTDKEPSFSKPNVSESSIKPSDLKSMCWQSSYSKAHSELLDPQSNFVKLSDIDIIDFKDYGSYRSRLQKAKVASLSSISTSKNPKENFQNLNELKTCVPEPNDNNIEIADSKVFQFKSNALKAIDQKSTVDNQKCLEPSDLNITRKEWEARYFKIIQNDLKPKDLNLTEEQLDDRYSKIMGADLNLSKTLKTSKLFEMKSYEQPNKCEKPLKPTKTMKSKVLKIAEMFNGMITQVIKRENSVNDYKRFTNELSPEYKKPPQPRTRINKSILQNTPSPLPRPSPRPSPRLSKKTSQPTGCIVPDDVFNNLSVKDRALLFNKFMREISRRNPVFSITPEKFVSHNRSEFKVPTEKQESVKTLARALEARMIFPKQTVSESILSKPLEVKPNIGPAAQLTNTEKKTSEEDAIHYSSITVVLKPSPNKPRIHYLPKPKQGGLSMIRKKIKPSTVVVCPSIKRTSNQLSSSIPIEVYAPPRKIRRTRPERINTKKVLETPNLEKLFYSWMKQRHGLSYDTKPNDGVRPIVLSEKYDFNKTADTDTTIQNDESKAEKKSPVLQTKTLHKVFKSDPSESDSSLLTLPSSKANTDESQTDQAKESPADFEFIKPVRPPRKKKVKRATLTWKKDASIVEKLPLSTTDSDSDFKLLETHNQLKPKKQTPSADSIKVKKLVFKDSTQHSTENIFEVMTSPSEKTESNLSINNEAPAKPPRKGKCSPSPLSRNIHESVFENEDQGFETGSNGLSPVRQTTKSKLSKTLTTRPVVEKSPLFIKLERKMSEANQSPAAYSTPIKNNLNLCGKKNTPVKKSTWHTIFSPIQPSITRRRSWAETESRRNSVVMDVIREEQQQLPKMEETQAAKNDDFLPSTPTNDVCDKKSSFWISIGDLTISMDVYENSQDRLSLLYDVFSQKTRDHQNVDFGIDDVIYSPNEGASTEEMCLSLPKFDGVSHYWFASGDLAIPFQGNYITPERVNKIFNFIRESDIDKNQISFGVDEFEFSKIPDPMSPDPKFSIESSYSMLIGLHGQNNEQRNKFTWPSNSRNSTLYKTSDFDPSEFESDCFEASETGRLSFSPYGSNYFDMVSMQSGERTSAASFGSIGSPEMFTFEYENEPLDKLFENMKIKSPPSDTYLIEKPEQILKPLSPTNAIMVDKMIDSIRHQQNKLKIQEKDDKTKSSTPDVNNSLLDKYQGRPHVRKLHDIVKSIQIIGKSDFANCTAQQLESFLYFLTLYAETCLSTCSNHMNKIIEKLRDDKTILNKA